MSLADWEPDSNYETRKVHNPTGDPFWDGLGITKEQLEEAMQKSCDDQVKTLNEAARLTCEYEKTAVGGEEMKLRNKKTGEIVSLSLYGIQVNSRTEEQPIYHSLAELNAEWCDYEEPKRDYYYIDYNGTIKCFQYLDFDWQEEMKEIGNYFESKEEAELAVRKLKAWKRLKDKGFRFTDYDYASYNGKGCGQVFFNEVSDNINEIKEDLDLLFGGEE